MKRIIAAFLIVGFAASVACADWLSDFQENYKNKSIDLAVENALKEGIKPQIIAGQCFAIDQKLNPENLVKALYCAGVSGQEVYNVAQEFNISELIVTVGFEKSVTECGDRVADTQPYTPGGSQEIGSFGPESGPKDTPYASPSK